jgi:hypothetical protein
VIISDVSTLGGHVAEVYKMSKAYGIVIRNLKVRDIFENLGIEKRKILTCRCEGVGGVSSSPR